MPAAPLRPCSYPGCPSLVRGPASRCPQHAAVATATRKAQDVRRGSSTARGYGAAWQKHRAAFLEDLYFRQRTAGKHSRPWAACEICLERGVIARATDVDHRISRAQGGSEDFANLQGLCHRCHSQKTAREDGAWGRAPAGAVA